MTRYTVQTRLAQLKARRDHLLFQAEQQKLRQLDTLTFRHNLKVEGIHSKIGKAQRKIWDSKSGKTYVKRIEMGKQV